MFYLISIIIVVTLTAALVKLENDHRKRGDTTWEIFKKKLSFLFGILPVAIIVAIVVANFNIDNKIPNNEPTYNYMEDQCVELSDHLECTEI